MQLENIGTTILQLVQRYRLSQAALLLVLTPFTILAQVEEYAGQTASGAFYRIAIPDNWQPQQGLVIWNHGYQGYSASGPDASPSLGPLENEVLAGGFALAASSYSQTGWAVFSSHIDNLQLYQRFVELVGTPDRVFIQGASLGGIVTVRDLEAGFIPDVEGALLMCGASAGARNWSNALDLRVLYEAICQDVDNGELPTRSWYEIPDLVTGEFQFLRSIERCTGLISLQLFDPAVVSLFQSQEQRKRLDSILALTGLEPEFLPLVLGYAVFELPRLVNDKGKLAGARPFSNTGIDYGDSVINQLVQRNAALPSARQLLSANYTPTGATGGARIVSIHTSRDGLVSVDNQQFFAGLVAADRISTAVVVEEEPSHCGFSYPEGRAAWEALLDWTGGGAQPLAGDIQNKCLALADQAKDCRFDPDFVSGNDPVRYPRENRSASASNIVFQEASGQLAVANVQIAGEIPTYDIRLQLNATSSPRFNVTAVDTSGSDGGWAHRARYFPDESLLYLPSIQVLPPRPGSNRFDVYLRYTADGTQQGLQLLEYEQLP